MPYIMGVDGGNSKTYAVVVDESGNKLGSGLAGGGNHQTSGVDGAMLHIREAMHQALAKAGLNLDDIDFVQYGLAGADRQKDFAILRPALAAMPVQKWGLVCDTMEGLRTGSSGYTGVILVCGSGTNAAGRNREGQEVQTGGFGYLFGDGAGGGDMAIETFRAAVRSWEYREEPSLLPARVAEYFGYREMGDVVDDFLDHDRYTVPRDLTVLLHQVAEEGDALAIRILERTGHELGLAANSVIRRLGGFAGEKVPIVLVGSVLQQGKSPHLLSKLADTIGAEHAHIELLIPDMHPVYGAILLGMDHLGIPTTEGIYGKFASYGSYQDEAD